MTKIDIYSGFLGAGKTTLIKKMIKEAYHGQKLVLIENEFGEIGIDGGFLQEAGIQITEMNSGCICCSLVGDFGRALKKVIAEYAPDRILIEPSGVGKLSDVIGAVRKVTSDDVQLGNFVTVADATKCKMYMKNFGEFYNNQIETANTIILSRTDGMTEEKLDQCVSMIREHNKDAIIVTTPWPELTGEQLMEAMDRRSTIAIELAKLEEEAHHHHDHDDDDEECDDPDCSCHHHHHNDNDEDERDGIDEFVHIVRLDAQREGIHIAEGLEEHAFALHDRHTGLRADIAETEDGGAVGDDGTEVPAAGELVALLNVLLDLQARLGDARRVGERQIVLRLDRHARRNLDFSLPFAMQTKRFFCVIHVYSPVFYELGHGTRRIGASGS